MQQDTKPPLNHQQHSTSDWVSDAIHTAESQAHTHTLSQDSTHRHKHTFPGIHPTQTLTQAHIHTDSFNAWLHRALVTAGHQTVRSEVLTNYNTIVSTVKYATRLKRRVAMTGFRNFHKAGQPSYTPADQVYSSCRWCLISRLMKYRIPPQSAPQPRVSRAVRLHGVLSRPPVYSASNQRRHRHMPTAQPDQREDRQERADILLQTVRRRELWPGASHRQHNTHCGPGWSVVEQLARRKSLRLQTNSYTCRLDSHSAPSSIIAQLELLRGVLARRRVSTCRPWCTRSSAYLRCRTSQRPPCRSLPPES